MLSMMALAGCQGGSGTLDAITDTTGTVTPPATEIIPSFLSTSFVESFDAYSSLAQKLINTSARYLVQEFEWRIIPTNTSYSTYPLASSRAHYAHAAGLTGAGSTIAFVDTGFLTSHEAIRDHTISMASNVGIDTHGTSVVSAAAGNSSSMIGIAPGADLLLGSFDTYSTRTETTRLATDLGAVALNNSWGFSGPDGGSTFATQENFDSFFSHSSAASYLTALQNYAQNGVVVFAASNIKEDSQTSLLAGLPLFDPTLEAGWLAVINAATTRNDTQILTASRISSACLESARWCLAAEGAWEAAVSTSNTAYDLTTGTSLATPMVSGALALLQEAFPDLTPHQLRTRLLASTDQRFAEFAADGTTELAANFVRNYSDEWGLGFLDIRAALLPIGETGITMETGGTRSINSPLLRAGRTSGNAIARSLGDQTVIVNDALGDDFTVAATDLIAQPNLHDAVSRLSNALFDTSGSQLLADLGTSARLRLDDSTHMAFVGASGDAAAPLGVTLQKQFGNISFGASLLNDKGVFLPSSGRDANTKIASLEMGFDAYVSKSHALSFDFQYGAPIEEPRGPGTPQGMAFNSLGLTSTQSGMFHNDDSLSISLNMPSALSSGSTSLTLPTTRSTSGALHYSQFPIDLRPQNREIDASITYVRPITRSGNYYFGILHAENAGNVTGARDTGIMAGFNIHF